MATVRARYSLIPKANRRAIYNYLMTEGVIVVKKDAKLPLHPDLAMPNLHVMMTMKSLKSRNYVTEVYNWRHHYYTLNNEGIEYLRECLQVPAHIQPYTLMQRAPRGRFDGDQDIRRGGGGGDFGERRMGGRGRPFGERGGFERRGPPSHFQQSQQSPAAAPAAEFE